MSKIRSFINNLVVEGFKNIGFSIVRTRHPEISDLDWDLFNNIKNLTMTPPDRIFALMESLKYICSNRIEGDFVECGVWRGGNAVIAANILKRMECVEKKIWLYDTFDGMVEPDFIDRSSKGEYAKEIFEKVKNEKGGSNWSYASLDFVKHVISKTEYPADNFRFIVGKVEDTLILQDNIPEKICLLRLDTDWYSSTKIEMEVLFSRLVSGGVLIIDDYGDWQGSKKAVDEYFSLHSISIPLFRLGSGARIGVKN